MESEYKNSDILQKYQNAYMEEGKQSFQDSLMFTKIANLVFRLYFNLDSNEKQNCNCFTYLGNSLQLL